ncbi:MAG: anti-anti-sigma regulatory factor [Halocynthiibacter sp.]|jgi:chemotaxis protein CheX
MSGAITLDSRLDYQAIAPLSDALKAAPAGDMVLDACNVSHVGAQALQVILSAIKTRAASGGSSRIINVTDNCIDQLSLFGFTPESLTEPEAWT